MLIIRNRTVLIDAENCRDAKMTVFPPELSTELIHYYSLNAAITFIYEVRMMITWENNTLAFTKLEKLLVEVKEMKSVRRMQLIMLACVVLLTFPAMANMGSEWNVNDGARATNNEVSSLGDNPAMFQESRNIHLLPAEPYPCVPNSIPSDCKSNID